jgi:AraC-like DNA-binding protein
VFKESAEIDFGEGFQQYAWRVSPKILTEKLSALNGEPVASRLILNNVLYISRDMGKTLVNLMKCLADCLDMPESAARSIQAAEIEQAMLTNLLLSQLETPDVRPPGHNGLAAPRQVKAVESYIEAHWNEPLEIEAVAAVTGVGVRTMFRTFRRFRGYSPTEFLKRVRLRKAEEMLRAAGPDRRITDIAYACGYTTLSSFTRDFVAAFGRPPSELLKG